MDRDPTVADTIARLVFDPELEGAWLMTSLVAGTAIVRGDDRRVADEDHLGWLPLPDLLTEDPLPSSMAFGRRLLVAWGQVADHVVGPSRRTAVEADVDGVRELVELTIDWAGWPDGFWVVAVSVVPSRPGSLAEALDNADGKVRAILGAIRTSDA